MNTLPKMLFANLKLLSLLIILALPACVTTHKGNLVSNKAFNHETIKQGGLMVAAVVESERVAAKQSLEYAAVLHQKLQAANPALTIYSARDTLAAMGGSLYQQMLDSFTFHHVPSVALMRVIESKRPDTRYLLFARIIEDQVSHDKQLSKNALGKSELSLQTVRYISVSLLIYDLAAREKMVWGGGLQDVMADERKLFGQYSDEQIKQLYPPPPDKHAMLDRLFGKLATYLPQPDQ